MMRRAPHQHEPPLTRFHIELVHLYRDLILGLRDTGTQVLVKQDGFHVPKTIDPSWILYVTGSATGPYRLL